MREGTGDSGLSGPSEVQPQNQQAVILATIRKAKDSSSAPAAVFCPFGLSEFCSKSQAIPSLVKGFVVFLSLKSCFWGVTQGIFHTVVTGGQY